MNDFHPTSRQRDNLAKLAAYLEALPADYDKFKMNTYNTDASGEEPDFSTRPVISCGSAACAIGHGPAAGIRVYDDRSWWGYATRVFGTCDGSSLAGKRMFGIDNGGDHFDAAARIRKELEA